VWRVVEDEADVSGGIAVCSDDAADLVAIATAAVTASHSSSVWLKNSPAVPWV
jgi:hypothetical protein